MNVSEAAEELVRKILKNDRRTGRQIPKGLVDSASLRILMEDDDNKSAKKTRKNCTC